MQNILALVLTIIFVVVDVTLILTFATGAAVDSPQGGMGNALGDLYALGVAGFLTVYLLIFLFLYSRNKFTAAKVMCGILVLLHAGIVLLVGLS